MSDLIKKVSAEEIILERNKSLEFFERAIDMIEQANFHAARAGGEYATLSAEIGNARIYSRSHEDDDRKPEYVEDIRRELDERVWRHLKDESGLGTLMDRKASEDFDRQLKEAVPAVTIENVYSTFERLNAEKEIIWERGVVNVFRNLSREFRTNDEFRVGKKVIINGYGGIYGRVGDEIADVDRIFHVLDGKEPKDNVSNAAAHLRNHYRGSGRGIPIVTEYLTMTYYAKGTIHIAFNRLDLVDKVNLMIARACGGDSKLAERRAKRAGGV